MQQHTQHQRSANHEGSIEHRGVMQQGHYGRLALMIVLSFLAMYILMYTMVDRLDDVYNNINQFYMAGLMVAPMAIIELLLMGNMYPNKKLNAIVVGVSIVALIAFWIFIRQQSAISDQQFLRSMIPHHGGAILMCGKNRLKDPELQQLCRQIMASQQAEVDFMKSKLK